MPHLLLSLALLLPAAASAADWADALRRRIERIDSTTPGRLGVYVKRLDTGAAVGHGADQAWYLGSATKVPIAIAVLRQVEAGRLSLDTRVAVQATDQIDGPGQLVWDRPGAAYTVDSLLTRMLGVSDNTAANLLVRTVGEDRLNEVAASLLGQGAGRITTLTEVRRAVYAELHPDTRKLTNRQLVQVAAADMGPARVEAVRRALGVPASALQVRSIGEAYDRFYARGLNTATLEGYGRMLERLVRGELLGAEGTRRLFGYMKFGRRGDYRLEGGIPRSEPIIHKTGTQHRRACHMAVVNPQDGGAKAIVVATCAADMDDVREAGGIFRQVGEAVSATALAAMAR